MPKINSYILIFIIGIALGAFLNFLFLSSLHIDLHIKNLIWMMILAGILGGTVNYLFNQNNEFSSSDCLKNIIIGLVASALVPLFLNILSSDLIGSIGLGFRNNQISIEKIMESSNSYKYYI